jgi:hypothetical protein
MTIARSFTRGGGALTDALPCRRPRRSGQPGKLFDRCGAGVLSEHPGASSHEEPEPPRQLSGGQRSVLNYRHNWLRARSRRVFRHRIAVRPVRRRLRRQQCRESRQGRRAGRGLVDGRAPGTPGRVDRRVLFRPAHRPSGTFGAPPAGGVAGPLTSPGRGVHHVSGPGGSYGAGACCR